MVIEAIKYEIDYSTILENIGSRTDMQTLAGVLVCGLWNTAHGHWSLATRRP